MANKIMGIVRRLFVTDTSEQWGWQVEGADEQREEQVEVFQHIGFYSRPKLSSEPEVIVLNVGASQGHPVIIATRDEKIRPSLDEDETIIFNSTGGYVKIDKDGNITARAKSGGTVTVDDGSGAEALATNSQLKQLVDLLAGLGTWTPTPGDGGAALLAAVLALSIGPPLYPTGTTVLKGK